MPLLYPRDDLIQVFLETPFCGGGAMQEVWKGHNHSGGKKMNDEEIDQLKILLRKYFKAELHIWNTITGLSISVEDEEPESIFCSELISEGKFSDAEDQLLKLWMDEILQCLLTDSERGKYER